MSENPLHDDAPGTKGNPHTTDDPYPQRGYVFAPDGTHDGGDPIKNRSELWSWMMFIGIPNAARGREVMITDNLDYCNFHAKDGKLVFPDDDNLRKETGLE